MAAHSSFPSSKLSTGFLYCVSVTGITGERDRLPDQLLDQLDPSQFAAVVHLLEIMVPPEEDRDTLSPAEAKAVAEADAKGSNHQGHVHVKSVAIDDIEVPQFILRLFVEKYITPRYPGVGMDSTFPLPEKIDTATVGTHKLTLTQR